AIEDQPPEGSASVGELARDLRLRQSVLLRELRVARLASGSRVEVVPLEETKREGLAPRRALLAQRFEADREQRPDSLDVEIFLERPAGRYGVPGQLAVGGREIEGQQRSAGISLLASRRFSLVRDVAIQTDAQIGAEASLAGLVRSQVALFERAREKALGQILPLFIVGIPLHANVLVDGFPIGSDDEAEGALAFRGIVRA